MDQTGERKKSQAKKRPAHPALSSVNLKKLALWHLGRCKVYTGEEEDLALHS